MMFLTGIGRLSDDPQRQLLLAHILRTESQWLRSCYSTLRDRAVRQGIGKLGF